MIIKLTFMTPEARKKYGNSFASNFRNTLELRLLGTEARNLSGTYLSELEEKADYYKHVAMVKYLMDVTYYNKYILSEEEKEFVKQFVIDLYADFIVDNVEDANMTEYDCVIDLLETFDNVFERDCCLSIILPSCAVIQT